MLCSAWPVLRTLAAARGFGGVGVGKVYEIPEPADDEMRISPARATSGYKQGHNWRPDPSRPTATTSSWTACGLAGEKLPEPRAAYHLLHPPPACLRTCCCSAGGRTRRLRRAPVNTNRVAWASMKAARDS